MIPLGSLEPRMNSESAHARNFGSLRLILKLFLPSWNFFNDFDEVTQLEFCLSSDGAGESAWQPLHPTHSTRSWGRVIFNPEGNLELLEKSLLDRVATALRESPVSPQASFEPSEAGVMLARIVRGRLRESRSNTEGMTFRFRLVRVVATVAREILFESAPHSLVESAQ